MDTSHRTGCSGGCIAFLASDVFMDGVREGDEEAVRGLLQKDLHHVKRSLALSSTTAWHIAATRGHVSILQQLVDSIRNAPADSIHFLTPKFFRMLSSPSGPEQLIQRLLHQQTTKGFTPLMLAAERGHTEAVAYLRTIGADPWQADKNGLTALHHAAREGHVAVIHELLSDPPPPSALSCRLNSPTVKYVDALDLSGWVPLHYAVLRQQLEAAATLLSCDANLIARSLIYHPTVTNLPPGSSPLHIAASQGNLSMIQLLLRAYYEGAADLLPNQLGTVERRRRQRSQPDPRLVLSRTGRLAFHVALRFGRHDVLEWLDPSIPLMFLLSGPGDISEMSFASSATPLANVPRLTVLASNALHAMLVTSLERVEEEVQDFEKRRAQQLAAASDENNNNSLTRKTSGFRAKLSRAVLGRAGQEEPRKEFHPSNTRSSSRPSSRPTATRSASAQPPQRRLVFQTSVNHRTNGPTTAAHASRSRLLQILATSNPFDRQSDYIVENNRMGVAIPPNPTDEPLAILRRTTTNSRIALGQQPNDRMLTVPGTSTVMRNLLPTLRFGRGEDGGADLSDALPGGESPRIIAALPTAHSTPRIRHSDPGSVLHLYLNIAEAAAPADQPAAHASNAAITPIETGQPTSCTQAPSGSLSPTTRGGSRLTSSSADQGLSDVFPKVNIIRVGTELGKHSLHAGAAGLSQQSLRYSEPGCLDHFSYVPEAPGQPDSNPEDASATTQDLHRPDSHIIDNHNAGHVPMSVEPAMADVGSAEPAQDAMLCGCNNRDSGCNDGTAHDFPASELDTVQITDQISHLDTAPLSVAAVDLPGSVNGRTPLAGSVDLQTVHRRSNNPLEGIFTDAGVENGAQGTRLDASTSRQSADMCAGHSSRTTAAIAAVAAISTGGNYEDNEDVLEQQRASLGGFLNSITSTLRKMSGQVVPQRNSAKVPQGTARCATSSCSKSNSEMGPVPPVPLSDMGSEGSFTHAVVVGGPGGKEDVEDDVCPVCLDEIPNVRLMQCKHNLCLGCAKDLCSRYLLTPALCPYCRSIISGFELALMPLQRSQA